MVVLNVNAASIENERLSRATWQANLLRQVADDLIAFHGVPPREVRKLVLTIESGREPTVEIQRFSCADPESLGDSVFP